MNKFSRSRYKVLDPIPCPYEDDTCDHFVAIDKETGELTEIVRTGTNEVYPADEQQQQNWFKLGAL